MAANAVGSVKLPGYESVTVDNRTGLAELTQDIERGQCDVRKYRTMIIMLGRYDVLRERDSHMVLHRFIDAVRPLVSATRIVLTGPFPNGNEGFEMVRAIERTYGEWREELRNIRNVGFADVLYGFYENERVITDYVGRNGITNEGLLSLSAGLPGL